MVFILHIPECRAQVRRGALVLIKQRDDKARVRTIFPDGWLAYWRAHETGGDHPPPSLLDAEMTVLQAITGGQQNLLGSDEAVQNLLGSAVPARARVQKGDRGILHLVSGDSGDEFYSPP
ncbi:hypothetical protein PAPYR_12897 [Paratrimastix pyriformis]|uniref:Uncharacterized protein n=1 Tax=Paratrimastix pyriformis TaxID=342808 RepID=A0ABQ8U2Q4_9EUKA|nr:hypothetical protein PAPYR_12897 [Paratrimastix pyriformis]